MVKNGQQYCSWALTHNDDDDAQHGDHTPALILHIHLTVKWQLSKQGIRWPVPQDHIAGWSFEIIVITVLFNINRWPSAGFLIGSPAQTWLTHLSSDTQIRLIDPMKPEICTKMLRNLSEKLRVIFNWGKLSYSTCKHLRDCSDYFVVIFSFFFVFSMPSKVIITVIEFMLLDITRAQSEFESGPN